MGVQVSQADKVLHVSVLAPMDTDQHWGILVLLPHGETQVGPLFLPHDQVGVVRPGLHVGGDHPLIPTARVVPNGHVDRVQRPSIGSKIPGSEIELFADCYFTLISITCQPVPD